MRTHGWSGQVPQSDSEAVSRILDAAQDTLDRTEGDMSLADVARQLGVTRQTVYRYFPSVDHLILATAERATRPFTDQLVRHVSGIHEPAEVCVEALAFVFERLPHEQYLRIALAIGTPASRAAAVTSPAAVDQGVAVLRAFDVDWSGRGYDEAILREIMGHLLRLLQSLLVDPASTDSHDDIRDYLRRWLTPAIEGLPEAHRRRAVGSEM